MKGPLWNLTTLTGGASSGTGGLSVDDELIRPDAALNVSPCDRRRDPEPVLTARRERRQTSGDDFSQTERLLMASVLVARQVAIIGNRALLLSTSSRERQKLKPGVAEDVARRPGHRLYI